MISNGAYNSSFRNKLTSLTKMNVTSVPDPKWFQFLLDHDSYISHYSTTTPVIVTETLMSRYAYRVRDYVVDHADFTVELAFRIINRLEDDRDFNFSLVGDVILLPKSALITELYSQYRTNQSQFKKIS